MRLILMGTGPFAVPSFEALRDAGHEIALVVTKPQPAVRSRKGPPPAPVRTWAESAELPIFDPVSINDPESVDHIAAVGAKLMVVCDYGQILKPAALAASRLGGINLHGSLLPAYRGAAPVQRSLLSGDETTGVSVIHMTPRLDGGPIITTRETRISDQETAGELEERLSQIGIEATLQAIEKLADWDERSPIGQPQDPSRVSKAPRLSKAEAEIDWSRTSRQIDCHVRGMQPWPVAFTHITPPSAKQPIRLAIKQVKPLKITPPDAVPGEIIEGDGLCVATGDSAIEITRLQPAGKREMDASDFTRGHALPPGTRFH
tara:strand:+ start:337711 stop:338664 length:954 start_codon:yes stop_codon:yes gene_type:complete